LGFPFKSRRAEPSPSQRHGCRRTPLYNKISKMKYIERKREREKRKILCESKMDVDTNKSLREKKKLVSKKRDSRRWSRSTLYIIRYRYAHTIERDGENWTSTDCLV
jgi:hypothetical protein